MDEFFGLDWLATLLPGLEEAPLTSDEAEAFDVLRTHLEMWEGGTELSLDPNSTLPYARHIEGHSSESPPTIELNIAGPVTQVLLHESRAFSIGTIL